MNPEVFALFAIVLCAFVVINAQDPNENSDYIQCVISKLLTIFNFKKIYEI